MKKKLLITLCTLFIATRFSNANQTLWLDCIDHDVPVCTVDEDYFQDEEDYHAYIVELMEIYC